MTRARVNLNALLKREFLGHGSRRWTLSVDDSSIPFGTSTAMGAFGFRTVTRPPTWMRQVKNRVRTFPVFDDTCVISDQGIEFIFLPLRFLDIFDFIKFRFSVAMQSQISLVFVSQKRQF